MAQLPELVDKCYALQTRWTLKMLRSVMQTQLHWRVTSLSGVLGLLKRAHLSRKRARMHIHSPDPNYTTKRDRIRHLQASMGEQATLCQQVLNAASAPPGPILSLAPTASVKVLLYLDEMSYTRQPTIASVYAPQGRVQPHAELCTQGERIWRILGALNGHTGAVSYCQRAHITVATLRNFYAQLAQQYAQAERIYVVVDNWPVHYHPDVLVDLIEQPFAEVFKRPHNWPTQPSRAAPARLLPVVLVPLPTYASWLNPIEKLWRKTRQDLLHLHRQANDWLGLRAQVDAFLNQFTASSEELLRYTGLLPT